MSNTCDKIYFKALVNLFEKIQNSRGTSEKKRILQQFIADWRALHSEIYVSEVSGDAAAAGKSDTLFPILRLIVPSLDKDRPHFTMKEKRLAKALIKAAGMSDKSSSAQRLYNFRNTKGGGDFGALVFSIFRERCPSEELTPMTINQLNSLLDELGDADQAKCDEIFMTLMTKLPAICLKWFVRIILKDLKLGIGANVILDCIHPDSREIFDHTMNLKMAASPISDSATITLFNPFRPMLAERIDEKDIPKLFRNGSSVYIVETKLDGERVLVHFKDGDFRFFSRAGIDFTDSYRNLSAKLSSCLSSAVNSLILDGEMMVFDSEKDCSIDKGSAPVDVKSLITDGQYHPAFYVFDVLYLNDENLANKPLKERREVLRSVFTRTEHGFLTVVCADTFAKSPNEIINALNDAVANKYEGVVLKDPSSLYKPHGRQRAGWLKLKNDYVNSLGDDIDLLVAGGNFGLGRNTGVLSHFLCAVRSEVDNFSSFANVSSGFANSDLVKLNEQFVHTGSVKSVPPWLNNGTHGKMDVYFATPQDAIVIQVRAGQIIPSDKSPCGYTLRFPRFVCFRDGDKSWLETTHIDELKALLTSSASKRLSFEDVKEPSTHKKNKPFVPRISSKYLGPSHSDIKVDCNVFGYKEICVLSSDWRAKKDLEEKIIAFGGIVVQNAGKNTWLVAVSKKLTVHAKNVIESGLYDVVSVSWLERCISGKQLLPLFDNEILYKKSDNLFSVKQVRDEIAKCEPFVGCDFQEAVLHLGLDNSIFRTCKIYFDSDQFGPLGLSRVEARLNGARIVNNLDDPTLTHVVLKRNLLDNLDIFHKLNVKRSRKVHIVDEDWVWKSLSAGRLVDEKDFYI